MTTTTESLRRSVYALLITAAAGITAGQIVAVERVYEPSAFKPDGEGARPSQVWPTQRPTPTPTLRSNDRSRWAVVRALVDEGTYVIGRRDPKQATRDNPYGDVGIVFEDGWQTVDKILLREKGEFHSSKPPFVATIVAGEYWLLKKAFGWELADEAGRGLVVRSVLFTFNLLPLVIFLGLLARLVERLGETDWGRLYVLTAACFGTFMTAFAITLNDHTLAACSVLFAIHPTLRIWNGPAGPGWYALAGLFAGIATCAQFPAAAFAFALLIVLMTRSVPKTLVFFLPTLLLPVAFQCAANYQDLGTIKPAYSEFGGPRYEYPGSHWETKPGMVHSGIDWASEKESRAQYAFHFLLGHHGVFSLSPIWLLTVAGLALVLKPKREAGQPDPVDGGQSALGPPVDWDEKRLLAALTLGISMVVIAFFLGRQRWNYGGGTVGPRWLIWLTPLWLLVMVPVADRLSRTRAGRALALTALALSVFSVAFAFWSPWRHPWIYQWMDGRGWIPY